MTVLIPMAGRGERFAKENYKQPKPVLPVDGLPMVVKAALDLPAGERYVFIMLKDHIDKYHIDDVIKNHIPQAEFVTLDAVTEGQACTCMCGAEEADVKDDLMIGACDNGMIYDEKKFEQVKAQADVIAFTFRNNTTVIDKPLQYGWVENDADDFIKRVSVKKPVSNDVIHDHAIVGAFWFRNISFFKNAVEKMIGENRRINNEFYVDECMNDAVQLGYRTKVFEIDKYICWGTPNDYKTYNYWKEYFNTY